MLNTETYTSDSQAAPLTAGQVAGAAHHAATSVNGKATTSAQEITCQPPIRRDSTAPSA